MFFNVAVNINSKSCAQPVFHKLPLLEYTSNGLNLFFFNLRRTRVSCGKLIKV